MMAFSVAAMATGAGMMAYALNSKATKATAAKLVNNAMDVANNKLNNLK